MDDVTPQNLSNLQNVAREYISSISAEFDKICVALFARVKRYAWYRAMGASSGVDFNCPFRIAADDRRFHNQSSVPKGCRVLCH